METKPRILLADDREDILKALRVLLKGRGYETVCASNPREVLQQIKAQRFDVALLDLNYSRDITSGEEGLDLLAQIRKLESGLPVVVMTAWASLDLAVATVQQGASDFVEKPWNNQRLLTVLQNQVALGQALRDKSRLEAQNRLLSGSDGNHLIAGSAAMAGVLDLIDRIAPSDVNVLITGEHGTGKGMVARALHAQSERKGLSLVTVNIGALSDTLFESEIFGHVKGAFTDARGKREGRFQLADRGTLFLDEIGNLSPASQAKMLRVIETGEFEAVGSSRTERVDVRILSATNAPLASLVQEGRFREDLLFRLNTIEIPLPALRRRADDIPLLAEHFLRRHRERHRKNDLCFSAEALAVMSASDWPGNVRELEHVVQRGVLMARGHHIGVDDLGLSQNRAGSLDLEAMSLDEAEAYLIRRALERNGGNIKEAAADLGLGRSSLYRRLEKHGLDK